LALHFFFFFSQYLAFLEAVGTCYQTGSSSLFKYLAENCYQDFLDSAGCIFSNVIWQPIEE